MNKIAIFLIHIYRYLRKGGSCKFIPSCSEYSLIAYKKHSFIRATVLTVTRITRCHPWANPKYDPVPDCEGCTHCGKIPE
jgi:hypothetical protein